MAGEFTTDLPTGDLYVEIDKGFEYAPVRRKVTIRPGQKVLELQIDRWANLRMDGWKKVQNGMTSIDEVLRITTAFDLRYDM